ncbi:MAG TPA: DUF1223 domain-containing protein [Thermoanaerobaculia bacterium]|jgi:hypothetical protein|nr:DUF1223 domain-containing protein [Thermoanaerobaculia bacterium]
MFRPRLVLVIAAIAILAALTLTMHGAPPKLGPSPVIVELFTSQGCSSCPPADALIHDIADDPAMRGRVIPLAFHVDYWDSLGWRDPFSSADWTKRQALYARTMRLSSAYTPQAVVNGTREFVGSNRAAMSVALEKASNEKQRSEITLTAHREGNSLIATIHANVPANGDLFLAVVEDGVTTTIEHGENAGRTLTNDAIVRKLVRVTAGQTMVAVPLNSAGHNVSATAFVQDRGTLMIGGAATTQVR